MLYRFAAGKTTSYSRRNKQRIIVSPQDSDASFAFRPDEYELAECFDGTRTPEQALSEAARERNVKISEEELHSFVDRLLDIGLLVPAISAPPPASARLPWLDRVLNRRDDGVENSAPIEVSAEASPVVEVAPDEAKVVPITLADEAPIQGRGRAGRRRVARAPAQTPEAEAAQKRRQRWVLIGVAVLLVGLAFVPYTHEPGGDFVVQPLHRADVRALIDGDVRKILVSEGDIVEAGQVLGRMADDEERTAVLVAESKLDALRANLALAHAGASDAELALSRQRIETAKTRLEFSKASAGRSRALFEQDLISREEYDRELRNADLDRERIKEAERNLEVLETGTRREELQAIEADIARADSQLAYAKQQFSYTELRTPIAGRVVASNIIYAVGDFLREGDLLGVIEDTSEVLVEISLPEAQADEIAVGNNVSIKAWAYPSREFKGTVLRISPTAEVAEQRGRVIRVTTQIGNSEGLLRSDMTGYAKVEGETRAAFFVFTRALTRFFQIEFWSWLP